jgi:hypothetical protein
MKVSFYDFGKWRCLIPASCLAEAVFRTAKIGARDRHGIVNVFWHGFLHENQPKDA